jgi:flagellin
MNRVQGLAVSDTMTFQVGVAGGAGNQVVLSLHSMTLAALSLDHGNANVNTMTAAQNALDQVDIALSRLNTRRSQMAATFTQLQASFDVSANDREALLNTLNVIRDTDYAVESTNLAQNQIRSQAAVSILSQANTIPQLALQLLQG